MNASALKALALDALYQVLDNWVFRILLGLVGVVVMITFVLGLREEEVVLLFGLKSWSYPDLFRAFGVPSVPPDAQGVLLDIYLGLVFQQLAGKFGVVFCIAASAFFVPQMIEKGAADVLLHKPLSRLTFYLARYLSGLLFVGLLALLMAAGIYVGVLLVSGRNDPGILFAAPLLTYVFALIYPVSMAIGAFTRSTVASILLTSLFFLFNGCVHYSWDTFFRDQGADGAQEEERGTALRALEGTVNTLHFTLPKTADAYPMTADLRRWANPVVYRDAATGMTLFRMPPDTNEAPASAPALLSEAQATELLGEPRFALAGDDDGRFASATLYLRPARTTERERRGETSLDVESTRDAAELMLDTLESIPGVTQAKRGLTAFGTHGDGDASSARSVRWWETDAEGQRRARIAVLMLVSDTSTEPARASIQTIWLEDAQAQPPSSPADEEADEEALEELSDGLIDGLTPFMGTRAERGADERRLTFDGPLADNVFFSLGSSLLFVLVCLGLGWFRLSRIEF